MPASHRYAFGMSTVRETPEMRALRLAIAGEVRAIMARKQISGSEMARQMGVEQSWFSRRYSGKVAWTAGELALVSNIMDEDITRVYAAGALALAELPRPTNLCLSDSEMVGSKDMRTGWAQRGYELGQRLFNGQLTVDNRVKVA